MKKSLLIFTLLFSTLMFPSASYAEWKKVSKTVRGTVSYVDFERIRKHDGYVYYWILFDYLKPTKHGTFSGKAYIQGDCKLFRTKWLSDLYFKGQMGKGDSNGGSNEPDKEWSYPPPNGVSEFVLKQVCSR